VAVLVVVVLAVSGCAGDDRGGAAGGGGTGTADEIPEVVDASATPEAGGTYRFDVTISSPYDRPERYADAWRVIGPDGTVLGVRELAHDHAAEQPFTRSLSGVEIQADVVSAVGPVSLSGKGSEDPGGEQSERACSGCRIDSGRSGHGC
jgi:hypothetical protein